MEFGTALSASKQRVLDSRYHEKVLNDLAKKNKRCADCSKPSPSYVNLTLGTFVCLECSGILREFGFRTKGVGLSAFTPQEVQMLDVNGGNKRANEVYLGKHPDGEKASPGWDNMDALKRFLVKKYRDKQWYDQEAADRPVEPVRSRADSSSSLSPALGSPSQSGRKRAGSKEGVVRGANALMSGGESHRSFLAATHARAAAQRQDTQTPPDGDDDTGDDDDDAFYSSEGESNDPAEREKHHRERLRRKLADFYQAHNPEKLDSVDLFVEWILYHGMGAFNRKLREKYGTDIPADRKNDLKARKDRQKAKEIRARPLKPEILEQAAQLQALEEAAQALALHDLASRKRAGSTNPFDDFDSETSASTSVPPSALLYTAPPRNPFEDLMFL